MNQIDVMLVQHALRDVEKVLEAVKSNDVLGTFRATLDLIMARGNLRAALVGNVEAKETV